MDESEGHLKPYEKHIGCFIGAILISLAFFSGPKGKQGLCEKNEVSIHVVGAVEETDVKLPYGATVDDLLERIVILSSADLLEIDGNKKIMEDGTIVIPFDEGITLYVVGAVQHKKLLVLPKGCSSQAILDQLELMQEADRARFKRRRVFKTGMIIDIPFKKV
jgi:hypothetical protein